MAWLLPLTAKSECVYLANSEICLDMAFWQVGCANSLTGAYQYYNEGPAITGTYTRTYVTAVC
eukprot:1395225-Amorphochlora_amoeboformis.AAC.2